ncbi:Diacylglycerol kinase (ATP) [Luteimicrobium xylanilyticum]|uniref:Diacylglycerol kinase (ATP) n=1 Tax=Luteimicrobium xylanilyticum TaxID=1133546 RepID=A0A5P9QA08_9MICO|nr:diacylglycerol kinase family protein [Luteimicrobium xylanilyticum]QFU98283.1 Diacylglycerol kinase (ATP) [Luteimicrobium xylanilyticum]
MSHRALGVVVNPTADRGHADRAGVRTLARLREQGHHVRELSGTSFDDALARARAAVADGLDALVVVGGDGMVHLGANACAGTGTPLGIMAAGSGNDYARALGLPVRDTDRAVRVLLDALDTGARVVDAARVTSDDPDEEPRWFCGVLSAGLDAAVNARANTMRRPRGRARYAVAALRELARFRPFGYRVTIESRTGAGSTVTSVWESPGTLVAVANGPAIGGGIRIAPDALVDDGDLDLVLAGPLSRHGALRVFPLTYAGRHVGHPVVDVRRVVRVRLEPTDDGVPPPPAFADGELVGTLPREVHVVPGALRVLAARPA